MNNQELVDALIAAAAAMDKAECKARYVCIGAGWGVEPGWYERTASGWEYRGAEL